MSRKQPFPPEADTVPGIRRSPVARPQSGPAPKGDLDRSEAPTLPPPPSGDPGDEPKKSDAARSADRRPADPRRAREPRTPTPQTRPATRAAREKTSTLPPSPSPQPTRERKTPVPAAPARGAAREATAPSRPAKKAPGSDVREVATRRRAPSAATIDEVTADLSKDPRREHGGGEREDPE